MPETLDNTELIDQEAVQAFLDSIASQKAEFHAGLGERKTREAQRKRETIAAEAELHRLNRVANLINSGPGGTLETRQQIKIKRSLAMVRLIDQTAEAGAVTIEPLKEVRTLMRRLDDLVLILDQLALFLQTAHETVAVCREAELLAEADTIDALIALREYERNLALIPLAAVEGEVKIDDSVGVTAQLRVMSAQIKLRASAIRQEVSEKAR